MDNSLTSFQSCISSHASSQNFSHNFHYFWFNGISRPSHNPSHTPWLGLHLSVCWGILRTVKYQYLQCSLATWMESTLTKHTILFHDLGFCIYFLSLLKKVFPLSLVDQTSNHLSKQLYLCFNQTLVNSSLVNVPHGIVFINCLTYKFQPC